MCFTGCGPVDHSDEPVEAHGEALDDGEPGDGELGDGELGDEAAASPAGEEAFTSREILRGLSYPMRVVWGPDGHLWLTERTAKRIVRVNPVDGALTPAVTISDAFQSGGQDGVLGLALHPALLEGKGKDYVYVSFTYDVDPGAAVDRRTKIRRYTYDAATQTLGSPVDVITGLPGSDDHNSARLMIGPDRKLYYTIGDQGNNQFGRKCLPIRAQDLPTAAEVAAQDWSTYQGKILRLNLDGSIPHDNPQIDGVRSHIYSYGHRNPQGLTFGRGGKLYANEHGPKSDDELNLIKPGRNYGWPHVAGYQDDQAYTYDNWSASSPTPCESLVWDDYTPPPSVPRQLESAFSQPFKEPLLTFFTVPNDYDFFDPACGFLQYICWPTIAPSSLHYYRAGNGIPGWGNSLLMTTLKKGALYRVKLSPNGKSAVGEPAVLFKTINRYRDLAMSPDRKTLYVITDTAGNTSGPTGGATTVLDNPGAILEFKYTGTP
ncbi:glucose/sorbosone family PQQ-dependent dehydrogenase [Sorangium cellulosum]|uniref:glucose/sorbosone family PQQ-dependent dehydrogenase n=1 Tax=Sorangium cellulosum TaxID=56 RepID=UPI000CF3C1F0|nr:glucose/sorbosone family PQQ-dependent dehydrogenase [Sorangium cellulosum]